MVMLKSASKFVFALLAVTLAVNYTICVIKGTIVPDGKDFIMLVGMAFSYYFGSNKPTSSETTST